MAAIFMSPQQNLNIAVERSKFDNAERVAAHGPQKHAHDSMACHEVPLG